MAEQGFYVRGWLIARKVVWLKPANQTGGYRPAIMHNIIVMLCANLLATSFASYVA